MQRSLQVFVPIGEQAAHELLIGHALSCISDPACFSVLPAHAPWSPPHPQGQYPSGPYHQQYPGSSPYPGQQGHPEQSHQGGGGPAGPYPSYGPLSSQPPPGHSGSYGGPPHPSTWQSQGPAAQQQYHAYAGGGGAPPTQQRHDQPAPSYGGAPAQGTGGHVQNVGTYFNDVFK